MAPAKTVAKSVAKAPLKKKEPTKVLKFKTWEICDYGADTIKFTADEVMPGMTFNLFNCEKTTVIIEGKCKNFMLSRCKHVKLQVYNVLSLGEIIKSERIKLYLQKYVPMISVELSHAVEIFLTNDTKNVQVKCTASQSVALTYPMLEGTYDPNDEEADDAITVPVPETWLAKIDAKDELQVTPEEGMGPKNNRK